MAATAPPLDFSNIDGFFQRSQKDRRAASAAPGGPVGQVKIQRDRLCQLYRSISVGIFICQIH
jgi:hypothetical protein